MFIIAVLAGNISMKDRLEVPEWQGYSRIKTARKNRF